MNIYTKQLPNTGKRAGAAPSQRKDRGAATSLTFLGIELQTVQQTLRLPQNQLVDLRSRIDSLLYKRKTSPKDLRKIVGHLNLP